MISFEKAQKLIEEQCQPLAIEDIPIAAALGRVNAQDLESPLALPLFDNSAMDGFLLKADRTSGASDKDPVLFRIKGAIKAGDEKPVVLGNKETCRIMTGAPLAGNADTVIAKERAVVEGDFLVVRAPLEKGMNVRYQGEELQKGKLVLRKGSVINPGIIGFLASMGIDWVSTYRTPKISLMATGSELIPAGSSLRRGKIYDANTPMIKAALDEMGIRAIFIRKLMDEPKVMERVLVFALKESDVVILTGGVSVGDYDYVKDLLQNAGVQTIFWGVSQKPGKPLYFGKKEKTLVFGLPGNPASVFTCFYEYVYPAIRMLTGHPSPYLRSGVMKLSQSLKTDPEKTLFLKGKTDGPYTVVPLGHQKSHMLSSLCEADSLMVVPPAQRPMEAGEEMTVHSLPYAQETIP